MISSTSEFPRTANVLLEVHSNQRIGASHQSLRDVVTEAIREAIVYGRYHPGERLIEDKLALELDVSRNPIREALLALEGEGLVRMAPRKGATVASLSQEEAREIVELRAALEGLSARLAARRSTPELRGKIGALLDRGERAAAADDADALEQINNEFHSLLGEGGANRFLAESMRSLRYKTYWLFGRALGERVQESWKEHAEICRAIAAGDEELAALLANRHVLNVGQESMRDCRPGDER